jgi:hypothetical protein
MRKFLFLAFFVTLNGIPAAGYNVFANPALQSQIIWQLHGGKDFLGPVQKVAVDSDGKVAYLATRVNLYEIRNGSVRIFAEGPKKEARLALAPGGSVYGWLLPDPRRHGFYVTLFNISGSKIGDLKLEDFPYTFSILYLGLTGKLIVTASPLDDQEGIRGRFQFNFWNQKAEMLRKLVLNGRQIGIVDSRGETILLMGKEEAVAYSASGRELWRLPGGFSKGNIAGGGRVALLNPSSLERLNQVFIYRAGEKPAVINIPTPVHDFALIPDGSLAVVVGNEGRYFFLDTSTGNVREGNQLPLQGDFYITNLKFVDKNTLAMGVLHRKGEPPKVTWPTGTILVIDLEGKVAFQKELSIQQASSLDPTIEAVFGNRFIVGHTKETLLLIELGR